VRARLDARVCALCSVGRPRRRVRGPRPPSPGVARACPVSLAVLEPAPAVCQHAQQAPPVALRHMHSFFFAQANTPRSATRPPRAGPGTRHCPAGRPPARPGRRRPGRPPWPPGRPPRLSGPFASLVSFFFFASDEQECPPSLSVFLRRKGAFRLVFFTSSTAGLARERGHGTTPSSCRPRMGGPAWHGQPGRAQRRDRGRRSSGGPSWKERRRRSRSLAFLPGSRGPRRGAHVPLSARWGKEGPRTGRLRPAVPRVRAAARATSPARVLVFFFTARAHGLSSPCTQSPGSWRTLSWPREGWAV
jgi:hypothetical protein